MKTAERVNRLGIENAFEVLKEVQKLEAQGKQIISFAIGEPDFDTPEHIKEACVQALRHNRTHYSPSAGILPLRQAIADYIGRTRQISAAPENVVVTPGGKPIIYYSIHALVDPGDEVIYPNPGFPIYESVIRFVSGVPIPAPLLEEKGFSLDVEHLETLITPKTKLIILNSPQNPTGGLIPLEDLKRIAELAVRHDLWVLSDEVYSRLIYEGEFASIASLPGMQERTIILDGFSKTYAMTGWRLGYGVMNKDLAELVSRLVTNCESCTNTFIQDAAVAALTGPQEAVDSMVRELRERRDLIVDGLNAIPGFSCRAPGGAFYAFPNVTEACRLYGFQNAKELQQYLLYEGHVAVLPRTSFGQRHSFETEEYLRFSYATSPDTIREGLARIRKALERRLAEV